MAKKRTRKNADCKCNATVNEQLIEHGVELDMGFQLNFSTGKANDSGPFITVRWIDKPKRGKSLPIMHCTFCPFCGRKKN